MIQDVTNARQDKTVEDLKRATKEQKLQKLGDIARQFESVFLEMMMKSMRTTIKKSGFMDGGKAEETFTSLLDQNIVDRASENPRRGLGIAKMILKHYGKHIHEDPKVDAVHRSATDETGQGAKVDVKG